MGQAAAILDGSARGRSIPAGGCPAALLRPGAPGQGLVPSWAALRLAVPRRVVWRGRVSRVRWVGAERGPRLGRPSAAPGLTASCACGGRGDRDHRSSTQD